MPCHVCARIQKNLLVVDEIFTDPSAIPELRTIYEKSLCRLVQGLLYFCGAGGGRTGADLLFMDPELKIQTLSAEVVKDRLEFANKLLSVCFRIFHLHVVRY